MCRLPWAQHHRSLLSHQEVQEAPEQNKNEYTITLLEKETIMFQARATIGVLNDLLLFVLLTAFIPIAPAWDFIWHLIWLLEHIVVMHWNMKCL